jgi:type I restriction enzyme S subunit
MIAEKLKKSILQAAIQGKLTQREPGDGTAAELLQKIAAEKDKLIKEKKIRKEKPLTAITEEEKLFDLPEGWAWCKLGEISLYITDGTHLRPNYVSKGIPFLSVKDISSGRLNFSNTKFVSRETHDELIQRCFPKKNDILITKVGTTGIPVLIDTDREFSLFVSIALIKYLDTEIFPQYFVYLLNSPLVQEQVSIHTRGVGNKNWVLKDIKNTVVILPPLAEQQRIVARVEELLFQVDSLSKDEKKLDALQSTMPERLKASLLQAAIQGKLTERLPGDGNAEDLLAEIAAEKQRLIKAKKIKKEKPLPEITEEEKPFNLPDGWEWCRLGEITYNHGQKKPNVPFTYVDISSVDNKHQKLGDLSNIIQPDKAPSRARKIIKFGDVIYATVRPYLHNMCIIDRNIIPEPIVSTGFAVFCTPMNILNRYLFYYLLAPQFDVYANSNENAKGVAYPAINDDRLSKAMISLPPLAEQQRIVQRLEELLPLCEGILSGK